MARQSKTDRRTLAAGIVAGIRKRFPKDETYWLQGKSFTHAALVALFQEYVDVAEQTRLARAAVKAAEAKEVALGSRLEEYAQAIRGIIVPRFGELALPEFGLKAYRKPGPKTAMAKAVGVLKARATREARGTRRKRRGADRVG